LAAFQCEICGRRFGVPSNLNRHTKKCVDRPVNAPYRRARKVNRGQLAEDVPEEKMGKSVPPPEQPKERRRRRAPSPTVWIPQSLQGFNLRSEEFHKCTPVPLPPVSPLFSPTEERNSWDEGAGVEPYHPREWDKLGRLPGPAALIASTFNPGG
jgi:hypothetical protein